MGYTVLGKVSDNTEQKSQQGYKVLGSMADQASAGVASVSETVSGVAQSVGDTISDLGTKAVDKASAGVASVSETVSGVAQSVGDTISDLGTKAVDLATTVTQGNPLQDALSRRPQSLQEAGDNLLIPTQSLQKAGAIISELMTKVTPSPETAVRAGRYLAPIASELLPINAAKFTEFLSNDGQISLTTEDLGSDADFLREAAIKTIQDGGNKFTYETWGFEDKSILMSDLRTTAAKSFTDPNYRMATLIGRTGDGNVRVEDGRIVVEDVYDFNSGPRGRKLQQALVLKETGDMEGYEKLAEEAMGDLPYFGQVRVWGYALGVPQGEGTRFKLDLGPAPEGM